VPRERELQRRDRLRVAEERLLAERDVEQRARLRAEPVRCLELDERGLVVPVLEQLHAVLHVLLVRIGLRVSGARGNGHRGRHASGAGEEARRDGAPESRGAARGRPTRFHSRPARRPRGSPLRSR
jgi:hypothetical protein